MEGDMAELVRHDAVIGEGLLQRLGRAEHFHDRALRVFEGHHVVDAGLGILLARGADALRRGLLLEAVEIAVRSELEADRGATRMRSGAQDDRVMLDRVGQVGGVAFARDQRQAQDVGVIFKLVLEIRQLVTRMRDFLHPDHGATPFQLLRLVSKYSRMAPTSRSPIPGTARP